MQQASTLIGAGALTVSIIFNIKQTMFSYTIDNMNWRSEQAGNYLPVLLAVFIY